MRIFIPKETHPGETRSALIPFNAEKLIKLGAEVEIEAGLGEILGLTPADYSSKGCLVSKDRKASLAAADMVLRLRKPPKEEIPLLKKGALHISFLDPFNEKELVQGLAAAGVSAISMEMIPRATLAQKMDALSSQASLAGYVAVLIAAGKLTRILPMMMTPAGTITPARVFIIGVGVAGLQAIATAKRLGARVEAFDTRPVVEDQVKSLGAKFVKIDLGETGQTKDGYAKALTEDQIRKQREGMAKHCAEADIIITTAQIFGKKAPILLTADMVKAMKPGGIVVDMAVETGGNVEGSRLNEIVNLNGVQIIGLGNLPGHVPVHASQMYSSNLGALIEHFWNKETKNFNLKLDDEIIKGCLITHGGEVINPAIKALVK